MTIALGTINNASSYNSPGFQNPQRVDAVAQITPKSRVSTSSISVETILKAAADTGTVKATRSFESQTQKVNNAISLVQSIDASAAIIESTLNEMKTLAMRNSGCGCQAMKRAQESIRDVANNFSWGGINYMVGGGQSDQTTTLMKINVPIGNDPKDDLEISLKSFDPMSAVDTDGELAPEIPNLPNLNKSEGTDTHVYGDAAMYSGLNEDRFLHTHTQAMRDNAIIQLTRALEGITDERERLANYLADLNLLAEDSQEKIWGNDIKVARILDPMHAIELAESSISQMLQGSTTTLLKLFESSESKLQILLN